MLFAHVDADSFFASVLLRKHPHLRGKPVLALGMGGGCVIAATYEAKALGVKTGMRLTDALKLVPHAEHLPSDFRETGLASDAIESILFARSPLLEKTSIDEWYMDVRGVVGGIPKDLTAWATDMRLEVLRKTAISVSIGVAPSKLLAKMAGEYRKPGGITVIPTNPPPPRGEGAPMGGEREITIEQLLRDRPAAAIPGIGHRRVIHTDARGWKTAWDIAQAPAHELKALFGKAGPELQQELLGNALSRIVTDPPLPKSVSRARSFRGEKDEQLIWAHVLRHLEYTILKMRRDDLCCRGFSLWLRNADYHHEGTGFSLPKPATTEDHLRPYVRKAFRELFRPGRKYTQVGLALWHLTPMGPEQGSLFEDVRKIDERLALQKSLDVLHERFGRNAITRGSAMAVKSGTMTGFDMAEFETAD